MPHPFDAANKHLVQAYPADWQVLAGLPAGTSLQIVDADLSLVSAAADKLIRVDGPSPYAAHHEFQSGPDEDLDLRVLTYNVLARRHLRLPVKSVVFALRPAAVSIRVRGGFSDTTDPDHELRFGYKLIRVWELSPEKLLAGGLGTLPLVPISAVTEAQLPALIDAMARRFDAETTPPVAADFWGVTRILMGLRWPNDLIGQLLKGARKMKESVVYQEIIEEGRVSEARSMVVLLGSQRFGAPDGHTQEELDAIGDISQLERIASRVLDSSVKNWDALLAANR